VVGVVVAVAVGVGVAVGVVVGVVVAVAVGVTGNPQKRKGDKAEREVAQLILDLTGWSARRKLGAGRHDDQGDIDGVPNTTIQVANYKDVASAIRLKVAGCVEQQERAGTTHGATFIRRPGGKYIVVLTPEQWATYARESV